MLHAAAALLLTALVACDDSKTEWTAPSVTAVQLNYERLSLVIGTDRLLVATVEPAAAADKTVLWQSDNPRIATVNADGLVAALAEGETTVEATTRDGSHKARCRITVTREVVPVTRVVLNRSSASLPAYETLRLIATVAPEDATNPEVTWSSSNPTVATVDRTGTVTGVDEGTATITVTTVDGGHTAGCEVTVTSATIPVESVTLKPGEMGLKIGSTAQLECVILPETATDKTVSWSSDDAGIVSVDDTGRITAHAPGTALITATALSGGKSGACRVTATDTQVYVVGFSGTTRSPRAQLWVNGVNTPLGEEQVASSASAVCVEAEDVYVAGVHDNMPVYWKNGTAHLLKEAGSSYVNDLQVANGKVYIAWDERVGWSWQARQWVDGVNTALSEQENTSAKAIYVADDNVYVAGTESYPYRDDRLALATVWKNGAAEPALTDGGGDAWLSSKATSIFVAGSDLYAAGTEMLPIISNPQARIWKNGELLYADEGEYSEVFDLWVEGTDVYACGIRTIDGAQRGVVWKNGEVAFTLGQNMAQGTSLYVHEGHVYVTGYANEFTGNVAKVWKDGQELYTLTVGDESVSTTGKSIFVK